MKCLAALLAGVFLLSSVDIANAQDSGAQYRTSKSKAAVRKKHRAYRRPSTVNAQGLCQRDTGKPDSELDFRNKCDTEEFWARNQERGTGPGDD